MKVLFGLTLLLAGCGPGDVPAPKLPPPAPVKTPKPPRLTSLPPPPAPAPEVRPEPATPALPPPIPRPRPGPLPGAKYDPEIGSPSLTFRTMDHGKADVHINGHRHSDTACLWSVTHNTEFDPKIPVTAWPPPDALRCAGGRQTDQYGSITFTIEAYIAGGNYREDETRRLRERHPHLVEGEHVLYVRTSGGGLDRTGAVRLLLVGKEGDLYRYSEYHPGQSDEDETSRRFARTLWFERSPRD